MSLFGALRRRAAASAALASRHRPRAAFATSARCVVRLIVLLAVLLTPLLAPLPALAVSSPADMLRDPAQEDRARALGKELRCMVCQNQSIEDSEVGLARDLRLIVRERIVAGDSDVQVKAFLHARYGDFVLLRPPFAWSTAILWATPVVALLFGFSLILAARRHMSAPAAAPLNAEEQARIAALDNQAALKSQATLKSQNGTRA